MVIASASLSATTMNRTIPIFGSVAAPLSSRQTFW